MMNMAQELQFERLKLSSFNSFDGDNVAHSLRQKQHLWKSWVFGRFEHFQLIELRDLHTGCINSDTLYILTTKPKLADLLIEIGKWYADEVSYTAEDKDLMFGGGLEKDEVIVRVWWD